MRGQADSAELRATGADQDRTTGALLTVSGIVPGDLAAQIARGSRPRADYLELAQALGADLLDYAKARDTAGRWSNVLERLGGPNLVLAYACWKLRGKYRTLLTDGEQVGIPLAALLKLSRGSRPKHVMITHLISVPKKSLLLDWLGLHRQIDRFIVYCSWQRDYIRGRWPVAPEQVCQIPFMVDERFFHPGSVEPRRGLRPLICAVGLERRDYTTMLEAVADIDADVIIAAASPWSKQKDGTTGRVPANVTFKKFSQFDLRQLYADCDLVVIPLQNVDFQAGITAILEGMAMGKTVICTKAPGQTDTIRDGETGCYVPVGDAKALRAAILHLLGERDERARLGTLARQSVERDFSLDLYASRVSELVRGVHGASK